MVGGTWRAMAVVAMDARNYPLSDPHGFQMPVTQVRAMLSRLERLTGDDLAGNPRISAMRASYLPDAGRLLSALLDRLQPDRIVFSSWGLREGVMFDDLADFVKAQDPLLSGVGEFAQSRGTSPTLATRVAAWTVGALRDSSITEGDAKSRAAPTRGSERLRLSATMLALASMQIEPNLRTGLAMDWALQKRWIDVDASGRAMMAATVSANKNECDLPAFLRDLASEEQLEQALQWGLAIRLCRRLGGLSPRVFAASRLAIDGDRLALTLEPAYEAAFGYSNRKDLNLLADRMNLTADLRIADTAFLR